MAPQRSDSQIDNPFAGEVKRIDLHCHSEASSDGAEAALDAIGCPESYSAPTDVYAQATRRGMNFVTITDHDTILGTQTLAALANMIIGEELTCWFPEDQCKMHVLVWGINADHHTKLQSLADDIYQVADYIERHNIAHAVAHPLYRQNDRLERWHVERLVLLFKGFECLNGAHSGLHRDAFEPLLEHLTPKEIQRLSDRHDLKARWPEPWIKARTGGSDDHGLLNVGRTWTEFPASVKTTDDLLNCIRLGLCRPGGEAGTSNKLAHAFYGVAVRYYSRQMTPPGTQPNLTAQLLQAFVGEKPAPSKAKIVRHIVTRKLKKFGGRIIHPLRATSSGGGGSLIGKLFLSSAKNRIAEHPSLMEALAQGLPPLGEHEEMSRLISSIDRDLTQGIAAACKTYAAEGHFTGFFDAISATLAQQFVLLPYYFALFHQNKERHLLRRLTGQLPRATNESMRVGLFTDTLDDINGVARFVTTMGRQASSQGRSLTVATCSKEPANPQSWRKNFAPALSGPMPLYKNLSLNLPPIRDVLDWADRQQFDAVHISTPGPMGLCGYLVGKMLRIPILGTYHTDFPAYADKLAGDHRMTSTVTHFMRWIYGRMDTVFSRSRQYLFNLRQLGIDGEKLQTLPPCVDTRRFHPGVKDESIWQSRGVNQPIRLLYCGRVSKEKNLAMLADVFKKISATRNDTALVIAGDGPYLPEMRQSLAGTPTYFLGAIPHEDLPAIYAGSNLLVFPSRTDTLGQVVLEAAACGLPAIVTLDGGPRDLVDQDITGILAPGDDPRKWITAITHLLDDPTRRHRLGRAAAAKTARLTETTTFDSFWSAHFAAVDRHQTTTAKAEGQPSTEPISATAEL